MSKFYQKLQDADLYNLNLEGDYNLIISQSTDGESTLTSSHNEDEHLKISINRGLIEFTDESITNEILADEFKGFKKSIVEEKGVFNNITTFISDALKAKSSLENNKRRIVLYLSIAKLSVLQDIVVNATNLNVSFNNCFLNSLKINCANLHFDNENLSVNDFIVDSSNFKSNFRLRGGDIIHIKSSNAKIKFSDSDNFFGSVNVTGSNIKVLGNSQPAASGLGEGNIVIDSSNGKVYFN